MGVNSRSSPNKHAMKKYRVTIYAETRNVSMSLTMNVEANSEDDARRIGEDALLVSPHPKDDVGLFMFHEVTNVDEVQEF